MPEYKISYRTQNRYFPEAKELVVELLVLPAENDNQTIISVDCLSSRGGSGYHSKNLFGFDVLKFRLKDGVTEFDFSIEAMVDKKLSNPFDFIGLDFNKERQVLNSDEFQIKNYLFLSFSDFTRLPDEYSSPVINDNESAFDFSKRVNQFAHNQFNYKLEPTEVTRKLNEVLASKKGVCQDYAHLMLAVLRKNQIPARYVCGYLNQGDNLLGSGAIHAWIQALIPGVGWIGFDPTNDLLEDHHYIKIAHGVDVGDCATIKGAIKGVGKNQTDYQVLVVEQSKNSNQ